MNHTYHTTNHLQLLIIPAAQGTLTSTGVAPFADGGGADRAVFELTLGTLSSGTVDMKLQQATTLGGSAKDITGAAITQIGTTTDECIKTIEIGPGALDDKNGYKWVTCVVTVSTGTPIWSLKLIKHKLRNTNVAQDSSYSEQVEVF